MKLSNLQERLSEYYAAPKSWHQRITRHPAHIRALQQFIDYHKQNFFADNNPDLKFNDFLTFAQQKGFSLDFNNDFLKSNASDAKLFLSWKILDDVIMNIRSWQTPTMMNSVVLHSPALAKFKIQKLKLEPSRFDLGIARSFAHSAFIGQTDNKKSEPINRFWRNPENLVEHACQFIAAEEIKTGQMFPDRYLLPQDLQTKIDGLLNEFQSGVMREKISSLIQPLSFQFTLFNPG
jgi:hypothetical protein